MSIWSTIFDIEISSRDDYGTDADDPVAIVDVATAPTMSTVIRLSLYGPSFDAEALVSPSEARKIAAALNDAADEYCR